jgi:hypothetical protein
MAKLATLSGPCGTSVSISVAESLSDYFIQYCNVELAPDTYPIHDSGFLVGRIASVVNEALFTHAK